MTVLTTILVALLAFLAAATIVLVRKMGSGGHSLPVTAEWISDLSTERYKPMLRLLDSADIEFLRSQPGYTPKMETKLRMQRCQVFRGYMRYLNTDFQRICMALKILMAQSEQDRPELASVLMHQQLLFTSGMLAIHCRLFMYRWGICNVNVASQMRIFESMRAELCNLVPSASASCA
jgi:hypothetical protein